MKAFVCLFFFLSSFLQALAPDIQHIVDKKELTIAMIMEDEVPFFMKDEKGELIGADVALAHQIAKELGVSVSFQRNYTYYDDVVDAVTEGRADIAISFLSKTLPRAKKVYFSTPYITLYQGLAVNRAQLASLKLPTFLMSELRKKKLKIGALIDSAYISFAKKLFPFSDIIPFPTNKAAIKAVKEGRIFALLTNELEIDRFILNQPDASIFIKTIFLKDLLDPIAIAVPPDKSHFLYFLNTFLEIKKPDLTMKKLIKEYKPYLKKSKKNARHP